MSITMMIKKDLLDARKSNDQIKKNLLNTLYSEITMIGKNQGNRPPEEITDEEAQAVVKKFVKGAEETYQLCVSAGKEEGVLQSKAELEMLKTYLPQQLSEEELNTLIIEIIKPMDLQNKGIMGSVMKELNAKYKGQFDGKKANQIITKLINP